MRADWFAAYATNGNLTTVPDDRRHATQKLFGVANDDDLAGRVQRSAPLE